MIGKFDEETIADHQEKFIRGKLATWTPKFKEISIESKDCQAGFDEGDSNEADRLLEEEILREIMEEEAKKKDDEDHSRKNIKGKKGKKKGKKGKKAQKEDL